MRIIPALTLLMLLSLVGCNPKDNSNSNQGGRSSNSSSRNANAGPVANFTPPEEIKPTEAADPSFKSCNPYFPLVPGSQTKYNLSYASGLKASVNIVTGQQGSQNGKPVFLETTQIVDSTGGLHKKSLDKKQYGCDGEKVQVISPQIIDNESDDNKAHVEVKFSSPAVAMIEASAVKPGTSWQYTFTEKFQRPGQPLTDTNKTYTVNMSVIGPQDVTVPAGTFHTVKIERKTETTIAYEYYARGIGLVKRELADGTLWELREFSGLKEEK
jgi:hypothetical protein